MAGYKWNVSVSDDAVAVELRRGEPGPGSKAGQSVPEEAVLRGVREGQATVRLELRRPWEGDKPAAEVIELQVTVHT